MGRRSQSRAGDGRARARTTPGPGYQVHRRTGAVNGRLAYPPPMLSPIPWLLVAALTAALAACASQAFDPSGPCDSDGRLPGAYPELEARVPGSFHGRAPDQLDSGRSCTQAALGPLAERGVDELRYAGGVWSTGAQSGVTLAVFSAPGLEPADMLAFYVAGTRSSRRIERVSSGEYTRNGLAMLRLDALNDGSDQSIVIWGDGDVVRVVLVADSLGELSGRADHERTVEDAVDGSTG
jgi:hypothetical protein